LGVGGLISMSEHKERLRNEAGFALMPIFGFCANIALAGFLETQKREWLNAFSYTTFIAGLVWGYLGTNPPVQSGGQNSHRGGDSEGTRREWDRLWGAMAEGERLLLEQRMEGEIQYLVSIGLPRESAHNMVRERTARQVLHPRRLEAGGVVPDFEAVRIDGGMPVSNGDDGVADAEANAQEDAWGGPSSSSLPIGAADEGVGDDGAVGGAGGASDRGNGGRLSEAEVVSLRVVLEESGIPIPSEFLCPIRLLSSAPL
jgi:hypothetical protein